MNKLFKLDNRLSVCAEFVRQDSALADIGTDHAYLPVWLAKKKIIKSAVAADVRPLPLKSGRENIEKYNCSDIVTTRLSDGLNEISSGEADDIVIAGMGAELICSIIDRAEWLKNPDKHLILQPMTKAHVLRKYLTDNGFEIISEKACTHAGKNYSVMLSVYSGTIKKYDVAFYYIGMLDSEDELAKSYMKQVLKKLTFKSNGRKHDGKDASELDKAIDEIKERFGVDLNGNG